MCVFWGFFFLVFIVANKCSFSERCFLYMGTVKGQWYGTLQNGWTQSVSTKAMHGKLFMTRDKQSRMACTSIVQRETEMTVICMLMYYMCELSLLWTDNWGVVYPYRGDSLSHIYPIARASASSKRTMQIWSKMKFFLTVGHPYLLTAIYFLSPGSGAVHELE